MNNTQNILTALVSFLLLTPLTETESGPMLDISRIGAQSMFLAIVVSIISVKLYKLIADKDIKIKMPASVPPAVAGPLSQ